MPKLNPPDPKRCQTEILGGSIFTFGPRKYERCKNVPVVIATEKKPAEDGLIGSMSLCAECLKRCRKARGNSFTIKKIKATSRPKAKPKPLSPDQLDDRTDSGKTLDAWLGRSVRLHFGPIGKLVRHKTRKYGVEFFFRCRACRQKDGPHYAVSGLHAGAWCYVYDAEGKYFACMRDDIWRCECSLEKVSR
jgi:hypothetical protein